MLILEVEKESKGTAEACFVQLVASELKNSQDSKGKIESQIKKIYSGPQSRKESDVSGTQD